MHKEEKQIQRKDDIHEEKKHIKKGYITRFQQRILCF